MEELAPRVADSNPITPAWSLGPQQGSRLAGCSPDVPPRPRGPVSASQGKPPVLHGRDYCSPDATSIICPVLLPPIPVPLPLNTSWWLGIEKMLGKGSEDS